MSEIFYLGIDLGTSRTSCATSTGVRLTTISCVGYSKDMISKKRLGQDYLLGEEAIKNRLALDMVWPLADGIIKSNDEKALQSTKLILQNIINQAIPGRKKEDKIFAAIGTPAQASVENKKDIINLAKDFIDKILIVSEPFAVAYGLDKFTESMIIDVGAGTVDLCRISGSLPEEKDQTTLTTAGNFLDREIEKAILNKCPRIQLTPQIIKQIKERHGYVNISEKVIVSLREKGIPKDCDITDILKDCCLKLTNPICKAVQTLVGDFDVEFQEKLRNNIIVAGGGSRLKGIDRAIEKGLEKYSGGNVICIQDPEFGGSTGALKMALEMPDNYWEEI